MFIGFRKLSNAGFEPAGGAFGAAVFNLGRAALAPSTAMDYRRP